MTFLAAAPPGTHPLTPVCGTQYVTLFIIKFYYCAFTLDTLVNSAIAVAITMAIAFTVANHLRTRTPGKLQMVLEFLLDYVRGLVRETVAEDATFIIPIAATIGLYILIANWIGFLPLGISPYLNPANSDLNQTLAMGITVILVVEAYSLKTLGLWGFLRRFTKPFELPALLRIVFVPFNIIEEVVKPVTLSLRLFGNIFAGILMIYLLTLLPPYVSWAPVLVWKLFDVFVIGSLQAFIFMLLTVMYFGAAREGMEEELHRAHAPGPSQAEGVPAPTPTQP